MASNVRYFLYQAMRRCTKSAEELSDHPKGQRTLAIQHLVDAIAFTNHWLQVFRLKTLLLHTELDGLEVVW